MKKFCLHLGVIVLLATGAGLVRARHLTWIPNVDEVIAQRQQKQQLHHTLREIAGISLERFQEMIHEGAVVIDARPAPAFEEGHLLIDSVPPVINIPPEAFNANINRLMELVGLPIVLYCTSDECDMAEDIYPELERLGFTDIRIYFPGYAGILEAKLPTTPGPDAWTGFDGELVGDESVAEPGESQESDDAPPAGDEPDPEEP